MLVITDKGKKRSFTWLFVMLLIVFLLGSVGIYAGLLLYITWPIDLHSLEKTGAFGDSFGILNALFSGLAFGGLIIALMLQRADLQLQRDEIQLTRKEIQSQNFENTFFQMLRLHNEIVSAAHVDFYEQWNTEDGPDSNTTLVSGRDCFREFVRRFELQLDQQPRHGKDASDLNIIQTAYNAFWDANQQSLGHYFRYLYRIFCFIDQSKIEDKRLYSGIARAQLSDLELLLLYYNCLSKYGIDKFKPLAEEYALFDNLPVKSILNRNHLSLYDLKAWGSQTETVAKRLEERMGSIMVRVKNGIGSRTVACNTSRPDPNLPADAKTARLKGIVLYAKRTIGTE